MENVNEYLNFISFQVGCELEVNNINFEAGKAIISRAIINLN